VLPAVAVVVVEAAAVAMVEVAEEAAVEIAETVEIAVTAEIVADATNSSSVPLGSTRLPSEAR
jgi:hypothetical protein